MGSGLGLGLRLGLWLGLGMRMRVARVRVTCSTEVVAPQLPPPSAAERLIPSLHALAANFPAQQQQSKWGDQSGRSTWAGICPARSVVTVWGVLCAWDQARRVRETMCAVHAERAERAVHVQRTCSASPTYTARGTASPAGVTQTTMWPGVWPGVARKLSCGARAASIAPPSPSNS